MAKKANSEIARSVGDALTKYRKAAGLSQAKVAELMGLSNDAISRMERGNITLNVDRLFEFAELFGCKPSDFLTAQSEILEEQSAHLLKLLSQLNSEDRKKLLNIMEQMVEWKNNIS